MNRKLTVNRLALGNLKARKKQYIIMIIGIILAMVFSSSIVFATSAITNSVSDLTDKMFGKSDIIWSNPNENLFEECKNKHFFSKSGDAHVMGLAYSTTKDNYDAVRVAWLDDNAMQFANPTLIDGRFPEKENEIAIELIKLSEMQIDAKIGDEITFNFYVQDGGDTLQKPIEKKYKLVGILESKINNIEFATGVDKDKLPAAFVCKNSVVELGGKEGIVRYCKLTQKVPYKVARKNFWNFIDNSSYDYTYRDLFMISKNEALYINNSPALNIQNGIIFAILIIAVFMLASCLSVINAFNTNLKERQKQIGMYRAVGATKRQIIIIYGRETLILSLITTPVSCLVSYFLVKALIGLMGENYTYHPSFWVFPVTALFGVVSVMLSALVPLVSASRITPIQSIRNIDTARKMKAKHIKTQKQYDVSSLISKRSVTFGKGKQIAVSLILIISIVASGYALSFYTYSAKNLFTNSSDYELALMSDGGYCVGVNFRNNNNGFNESDRAMVDTCGYIKNSNGVKQGFVNLLVPYNTGEYRKYYSGRYVESDSCGDEVTKDNYQKIFFTEENSPNDVQKLSEIFNTNDFMTETVYSSDEFGIKKFEESVWDGKINISKLNSGEEIILIAPRGVGYVKSDKDNSFCTTADGVKDGNYVFYDDCDFKAGDEIELASVFALAPTDVDGVNDDHTIIPDNVDVIRKKVKIGAIIELKDNFQGSYFMSDFGILTTNTAFNKLLPGMKYKDIDFYLNDTCSEAIDKEIQSIMNNVAIGVDQALVESNYGYQQLQKQENRKILISFMAIITLIFTIALSLVNNTITASIRNSKQKIGTLRAVGADASVLVKAYIKQMLSMIIWGIGIGSAGFCISYFILYIVGKASDNEHPLDFIFNPTASIIFIVILVIVCSANLYMKVKKEMKNSIVDNIKEL